MLRLFNVKKVLWSLLIEVNGGKNEIEEIFTCSVPFIRAACFVRMRAQKHHAQTDILAGN